MTLDVPIAKAKGVATNDDQIKHTDSYASIHFIDCLLFQWQRQGVTTDDEIGHTASYVSLLMILILQSLMMVLLLLR